MKRIVTLGIFAAFFAVAACGTADDNTDEINARITIPSDTIVTTPDTTGVDTTMINRDTMP